MKIKQFKRKKKLEKRFKADINSSGDSSIWLRLEKGLHTVRFVGDYVKRPRHFVRNSDGDGKSFNCSKRTKGYCLVCDYVDKLSKKGKEKKAKNSMASTRYLWNVISRKDPRNSEGEKIVKILDFGWTIFEELGGIAGEHGDITDIREGYDVVIKRREKGLGKKKNISYTVDVGEQVPLKKSEKNLELNDLNQFVQNPKDSEIIDFLELKGVKPRDLEEEDDDEEEEETEEEFDEDNEDEDDEEESEEEDDDEDEENEDNDEEDDEEEEDEEDDEEQPECIGEYEKGVEDCEECSSKKECKRKILGKSKKKKKKGKKKKK